MEVDDAVQLTSAVLLRRERATDTLRKVRSTVQATERAIEESRKLLAASEILLGQFQRVQNVSPAPLTTDQLEELAELVAKARGGYAFIWNANDVIPAFNSRPSSAIQ
jgi:hypothetical protein